MEAKNNLVIIDADSMMYIIGSELENLQLEPLGIMKLDEFISDILITTGSKEYLGFLGGTGRNFRKDVAVTKEYKGNRSAEKPEWFTFWQPILAERMVNHWNFQLCHNIEADDACAIARKKHEGQYSKITIASPDKDLFQIEDSWFYDYTKRVTLFCAKEVAILKLCHQLITGDSTDNIPGCMGAGKEAANKFIAELAKEKLEKTASIEKVKDFYIYWYTDVLRKKQAVKQEKEFLERYKKTNSLSRLTAAIKSTALKSFTLDTSMLLSKTEVLKLFKEQYTLVCLIDCEKEALKHKFVLADPILNTSIDWDKIDIFHEEIDNILQEEDEPFNFEEDL